MSKTQFIEPIPCGAFNTAVSMGQPYSVSAETQVTDITLYRLWSPFSNSKHLPNKTELTQPCEVDAISRVLHMGKQELAWLATTVITGQTRITMWVSCFQPCAIANSTFFLAPTRTSEAHPILKSNFQIPTWTGTSMKQPSSPCRAGEGHSQGCCAPGCSCH